MFWLLLFGLSLHFAYTVLKLKPAIHILQLNSYYNERYWRWIKEKLPVAFAIQNLLPFVTLVPIVFGWNLLAAAVFAASYLALWIKYFITPKKRAKKPLKFTTRVIRLYILAAVLLLALETGAAILVYWRANLLVDVVIILTMLNSFLPFYLIAINWLLKPVEKAVANWYINDARKILAKMNELKIIGITGSYGKTSTKHVLHEILRHKFTTLMTPGSYNTPMGICRVVRGDLNKMHEVFIAEMSAKQVGNIKEICDFVQPHWGILTSIGPQHLDTFKTLENIKNTKNELIECLPDDGVAFFNMDNEYCRELSKRTKKKSIYFGFDNSKGNLDYFVTDIKIDGKGSKFAVQCKDGESAVFQTKLLGEHNISNILASIAVAREMGIAFSDMLYPVRKLAQVEHRLELKRVENNVAIIDDAFNSNPVGSKMAVEVLGKIEGNKKIIITPGMVELGPEEDSLNCKFGEYIADVCDYVILVGKKQTASIAKGLKNKKYSEDKIYIAKDFNDAYRFLQTIVQANDVVLLENDLPDDYNE